MNIVVVVIAAIVVLIAGTGWLACGGWKAIGTRFEDDASSAVAISEIRVTGRSVAVEIRPGSASGADIHRTARYLNPFHSRPRPTQRIDGTVLQLGGDDSCTFCVIEYVVMAPLGVRVSAEIATGSLDLAGASTVDVKVRTGSVGIVGATGDVTARTDTREITGSGVRSSAVVAATKTGAISLDLAAPGDVDATTGTGSVDVTVPVAAYRVEAGTGLGRAVVGIANDPNGRYASRCTPGPARSGSPRNERHAARTPSAAPWPPPAIAPQTMADRHGRPARRLSMSLLLAIGLVVHGFINIGYVYNQVSFASTGPRVVTGALDAWGDRRRRRCAGGRDGRRLSAGSARDRPGSWCPPAGGDRSWSSPRSPLRPCSHSGQRAGPCPAC